MAIFMIKSPSAGGDLSTSTASPTTPLQDALSPTTRLEDASPVELLQDKEADFLDRLARLSDRITSNSGAAFGIALSSLAVATALRAVGGWADSDLGFAIFLPAILATGLLAGVPTAAAATLTSVLIVEWAFMPPYFQFKWVLAHGNQMGILWYGVSCLFTIYFAHCCRVVLKRLRRRELANQILVEELEHRGRNIFAVLEAILRRTLADEPERAKKILGRFRSVRYANELLLGISDHPINVETLLLQEFAPYGENRLKARGPKIDIEPQTARHLVLLFHELVTNAAKYGSLSSASGHVFVDWWRDGNSLTLTWKENGGPKLEPPNKQGFGTQLIVLCIESLSGTLQPNYSPDGFGCSMTIRIGR
ncbi:MAG: HWE histidine kinase domain-containing protein [Xanthobacteraceae bacterium]